MSLLISLNDSLVKRRECIFNYLCPLLCVCVNVTASVLCVNIHACLFLMLIQDESVL